MPVVLQCVEQAAKQKSTPYLDIHTCAVANMKGIDRNRWMNTRLPGGLKPLEVSVAAASSLVRVQKQSSSPVCFLSTADPMDE